MSESTDPAAAAAGFEAAAGASSDSSESAVWELVDAIHRSGTTEEIGRVALGAIARVLRQETAAVLWFGDDVTEASGHVGGASIDPAAVTTVREELVRRVALARHEGAEPRIGSAELRAIGFPSEAEVEQFRVVPVDGDQDILGALLVPWGQETRDSRAWLDPLVRQMGYAAARARAEARRAQAERSLEERSEELRRLVAETSDLGSIVRSIADAVSVAVMYYDTDNRPVLHNRMVEEILALTGYDPATGMSSHVYASDRRTPVKRDTDIVSETLEGDSRGVIYWVGDPDKDEQRAVLTEAHRVERPNGEPLGAAVVSYDVTDLANAIALREEYLAAVSHELRTPLTSIVGYLDVIADSYDLAELGFEAEFGIIQSNVEQMIQVVRNLAGSREQSLRIEPANLTEVVSRAIDSARASIDRADHRLEVELPSSSLIARVDVARVAQLLENLLSNAVKFTPPGGTIRVALDHDDNDAVLRVADTGPGISRRDRGRIFERFFRSPEARSAAIQGVGVGLTIAKVIVEAHGGTISVASEPGEGAEFIVRLPLRPRGAVSPAGDARG